eukprot:INCI1813.1.p1 GENE.INCI1813.1~~INCI1813.1.p1  ORF type:complete len:403 (+),score=70.80 INCI1813.1:200-1408(+)
MQWFSSRDQLLSEVSVVGDFAGSAPENGIVPLRLASDGKVHLCQFVDVATSTLRRFSDAEVILKLKCDAVARVEKVLWTAEEVSAEGSLTANITAVLVLEGLNEQSTPLAAADFNAAGTRPVVWAFLETLRFFHSLGLSGFHLSADSFYRCPDAAGAIYFCDVGQALKQLVCGSEDDGVEQTGHSLRWPAPETLFESVAEFEKVAADANRDHNSSQSLPSQQSTQVYPSLSEADVELQRRQARDVWIAGVEIVSNILKSSTAEAGQPQIFREGPKSANLSAYLGAVETVPRSFEGSLEFLALPRKVGKVISVMLRLLPLHRPTAEEGLKMLNDIDETPLHSTPCDAGHDSDNSLQSHNECARTEDESESEAKEPIQEAAQSKENERPPTARGKAGCDNCIIS